MTTRRLLRRVYNTVLTLTPVAGAATLVSVQFDSALANRTITLRAIRVIHIAGSAANNSLAIYEATPVAAEKRVATFSPVVSANLITLDDLLTGGQGLEPIPVRLDSLASMYLQPGPDAGVDNQYVYVIDYEEASHQAGEDKVN